MIDPSKMRNRHFQQLWLIIRVQELSPARNGDVLGVPKQTCLVGGMPTLLKNMSSSVGMILPQIWKNKIRVPNHQPDDKTYSYPNW